MERLKKDIKQLLVGTRTQTDALVNLHALLKRIERKAELAMDAPDVGAKVDELKVSIEEHMMYGSLERLIRLVEEQIQSTKELTEVVRYQQEYIGKNLPDMLHKQVYSRQKPMVAVGIALVILALFIAFSTNYFTSRSIKSLLNPPQTELRIPADSTQRE